MTDNPTPEAAMVELTDAAFLHDLATRMFCTVTPGMGFDQGDTDRLYRISRDLAAIQSAPPPVTGGELRCDFCDDGTEWSEHMQARVPCRLCRGTQQYTALATPATGGTFADGVEAWCAGRDAALKEAADCARSSKHLVHPLFVPAIEGIAHTLEPPSAIRALQPGAGREATRDTSAVTSDTDGVGREDGA